MSRSDTLIHQMLPKTMAENLKYGRPTSEMFESATILFSEVICVFLYIFVFVFHIYLYLYLYLHLHLKLTLCLIPFSEIDGFNDLARNCICIGICICICIYICIWNWLCAWSSSPRLTASTTLPEPARPLNFLRCSTLFTKPLMQESTNITSTRQGGHSLKHQRWWTFSSGWNYQRFLHGRLRAPCTEWGHAPLWGLNQFLVTCLFGFSSRLHLVTHYYSSLVFLDFLSDRTPLSRPHRCHSWGPPAP